MINQKKCIFCRNPKEEFTYEHVFPAAIGGAFVISTVCKDCNTTLGKNIDNPLSKNTIILFYRKIFDIKRKGILGERTIQNPFKSTGYHTDDKGNKHYISFDEEKKEFQPILVRQYENPVQAEGVGWIGKMTLPLKEYTNDEEIKKQYAKKFGLNPAEILSIKKETRPQKEVNVKLVSDNKPLMLGCLKIAYEYTMTFIPQYLDDAYSKMFANILLTDVIKEDEKKYFDYTSDIKEEFDKRISEIIELKAFHHLALLITIKGRGLYCAVKIFDWIYAIRLSEREDYLQSKQLLLLNDSINQGYWFDIPTRLTDFAVFLDLAILNEKQRKVIESSKGIGYTTMGGKFPIFDRNGKLVCSHLEELSHEIQISPEHYNHLDKQIVVPAVYETGKYYVKFFKGNLLVPLQKVNYIYSLLY